MLSWWLNGKLPKMISIILCMTILIQISSLPVWADVSIPLTPGWNLVSIPEEPVDTDPAAVLSSLDGSYTQVYAYDGCDAADPWKLYDPTDPAGSDLTAIDHTMGFWIDMTAADTLGVTSTPPSDPGMQLCQGWNLIGYPMNQALPVEGALSGIEGKYLRVFEHELLDSADPWAFFDVVAPNWANEVQIMQPGQGYWLLAAEDVTLTITDPNQPPTVEITSPAEGPYDRSSKPGSTALR